MHHLADKAGLVQQFCRGCERPVEVYWREGAPRHPGDERLERCVACGGSATLCDPAELTRGVS